MPRRKTLNPSFAQMVMFPDHASLVRIRPVLNEWRYYNMSVQRYLFGGASLTRHWGRIGTAGTQRLDLYTDAGAASNALGRLLRYRRKRGYQER